MFSRFYPDRIEKSVYDIDFSELYSKGKRGILFDIDNTLVMHGADADRESEDLFVRLHLLGFKTCLISNNGEERVMRFNKNIKTNYVYKAGKPFDKGYKKGMELMGTDEESTLFVGDSNVDVQTAHNGGLVCCGAGWGFRGEQELADAGAEIVLGKPIELLDVLGL